MHTDEIQRCCKLRRIQNFILLSLGNILIVAGIVAPFAVLPSLEASLWTPSVAFLTFLFTFLLGNNLRVCAGKDSVFDLFWRRKNLHR